MKTERSTSADYVTYLRYTSSSASVPYQELSAAPNSLANVMKNSVLVTSIEFSEIDEAGRGAEQTKK